MLTPFIKLGKSYIDIRSIERMKVVDRRKDGVMTPAVQILFKGSGFDGSWNYIGEEYDIDKIAKQIENFYEQIPEYEDDKITSRSEILDLSKGNNG